jgi:PQQ-dependent catabolism-associated CXXCW motif protein
MIGLLGAIFLAAMLTCSPARAATAEEPSTYRMEKYSAPVPATLQGARVATSEEAEKLWREHGAIFVDVLPRPPKPKDLPAGTVWHEPPHSDIPGSIWLPDTGYGSLAAATEDYLRQGLDRASNGDKTNLLVFYCQEDCWMSWNAAKRAQALGYRNVAWYPQGTDGWQRSDLPVAESQPLSRE